jgi:hypothetical protein
VYNGKLYAGTLPLAQLYRYDPLDDVTASLATSSAGSRGVRDDQGSGGDNPGDGAGQAKHWGGEDGAAAGQQWTMLKQLDLTPDVRYRRVWSLAVYQGRLFAGTLPSGRVWAMEAGLNVTYDRAVPPGWRHVAAVRAGGWLQLYLDGQLVAESARAASLDVDTAVPLRIGTGEHDSFRGSMADLRVYRRALDAREVAALAAQA